MEQKNWDIIGHSWVVDMLSRREESGKLGHAYLFTGPNGIGKSVLARRLAQVMNCTGENKPCMECRSCTHIERGIHPDIQVVQPDNNRIRIEAIRDLSRSLIVPPIEARYQVAIIEDLQTATPSATDALLKTLEEPPASVRLLLTADRPDNLLPTIVSRCQVMMLRSVPASVIAEAITAKMDTPPEQAELVARLAGGRPGWAINAIQEETVLEERQTLIDGIKNLTHATRAERFAAIDDMLKEDDLTAILNLWQTWWRDVMLRAENAATPVVNMDQVESLDVIARSISKEDIRRALRSIRETIRLTVETNVNNRLALEVMMLDIPFM